VTIIVSHGSSASGTNISPRLAQISPGNSSKPGCEYVLSSIEPIFLGHNQIMIMWITWILLGYTRFGFPVPFYSDRDYTLVTPRDALMEDDPVIVVDDVEAMEMQAGPSTAANGQSTSIISSDFPRPMSVAEHSMASSGRSTRSSSNPPVQQSMDASERTTRSATAKSKPQPKLKLKLSEKAAAQAPGMSFLGQYDRELDSDDEDLAFEEQFVLRMPPGEDLEKFRKMVAAREVTGDVWFKFKGASKPLRLEASPSFSV
jgi:hypothetical protein